MNSRIHTADPCAFSPRSGSRKISNAPKNAARTFQDRPGNKEIQLQLFYDYGSNPSLYPQWQAYFRAHQPPTLVVWGKNDVIFPADGAHPYKRDLKTIDFHLLDTGHFALEEAGDEMARHIRRFLKANIS